MSSASGHPFGSSASGQKSPVWLVLRTAQRPELLERSSGFRAISSRAVLAATGSRPVGNPERLEGFEGSRRLACGPAVCVIERACKADRLSPIEAASWYLRLPIRRWNDPARNRLKRRPRSERQVPANGCAALLQLAITESQGAKISSFSNAPSYRPSRVSRPSLCACVMAGFKTTQVYIELPSAATSVLGTPEREKNTLQRVGEE